MDLWKFAENANGVPSYSPARRRKGMGKAGGRASQLMRRRLPTPACSVSAATGREAAPPGSRFWVCGKSSGTRKPALGSPQGSAGGRWQLAVASRPCSQNRWGEPPPGTSAHTRCEGTRGAASLPVEHHWRDASGVPLSHIARRSTSTQATPRIENTPSLVTKLELGHALVCQAPASLVPHRTKLELRRQWHSQAGAWERGG